ncbi:hypothetical protein [Nocardia niigatensis]|uniref:hypothetical protein n=1 Tax=Nocardia niigatensis TaxID=209249 RepID=UPI0012F6959A|nr:hypothetical protein [Nocardia niigatensis]
MNSHRPRHPNSTVAEGTGVRVSTRSPLIGTSIVDEAQREVTASISREYVSRCSSASARLGNGLGEAAQGATQPAQGAARRRFGTVVDRPAPGAGPGGPAHLADHQPKPCNPLGGEQLRFLVKQHRPLLPADVAHPAERVDVQPVVSGLIGLGAEGESTDGPDLRQLELKNFVSQSVSCLVRPTATLWLLRGRSMG